MAKIDPYLRPLYDALYDMVEPEGAQRLLERQTVEVAPLAFMRGRTLNNSFIILDEAQNTTPEQMKMFLTRIGFGSRVVVTGDVTQVDVPNGKSGLLGLERVLTGIEGLAFVKLSASDVVRHRIVADIVAAYERNGEPAAGDAWASLRVPPPPRPSSRPRLTNRSWSAPTSRTPSPSTSSAGSTLAARRPRRRGPPRRADVDVRRPRRDRRAQRRAPRQGRPDRRAVVPARRRRRAAAPACPVLLGDVVVCPAVAAEQAPAHAGTLDDELALLVVHGVLHVLGHDHAEPAETARDARPRAALLEAAPLARPGAGRLPPGAHRSMSRQRRPHPARRSSSSSCC